MLLDTSLLNTQQYEVRIEGKGVSRGKEYRPLHLDVVAIEKGAFWSLSTTVANFTYCNISLTIQLKISHLFTHRWMIKQFNWTFR